MCGLCVFVTCGVFVSCPGGKDLNDKGKRQGKCVVYVPARKKKKGGKEVRKKERKEESVSYITVRRCICVCLFCCSSRLLCVVIVRRPLHPPTTLYADRVLGPKGILQYRCLVVVGPNG